MGEEVNRNEPLGLPRGSVRAIITFSLLAILAVSLFVPLAEGAEEVRSGLAVLCAVAVRDYFSGRKEQNTQDGPPLHDPVIGS